jgi:2-hydroxymuconate-semialdehyde hydrolase
VRRVLQNAVLQVSKSNHRQALINKIDTDLTQATVRAGSIGTTCLCAGEGHPVILLHGAGAGAVTWYPSIGTIAQHFQVIAPDIVGYGESDKPEAAYDRPYFVRWLNDFFTAMKISKAHIIGLSQGGAIALQFAMDYPDSVAKLVLVDSAGLGPAPATKPFLAMLWMNLFPSLLSNRFASRYLLVEPQRRDQHHVAYSVEVLKKAGGKNAFTRGRGAAVAPMSKACLSQIVSPTLIIWGEGDRFFPIEQGEMAAQLIPNARLQAIEGAGHLPMMDQPEMFNQYVIDFLLE